MAVKLWCTEAFHKNITLTPIFLFIKSLLLNSLRCIRACYNFKNWNLLLLFTISSFCVYLWFIDYNTFWSCWISLIRLFCSYCVSSSYTSRSYTIRFHCTLFWELTIVRRSFFPFPCSKIIPKFISFPNKVFKKFIFFLIFFVGIYKFIATFATSFKFESFFKLNLTHFFSFFYIYFTCLTGSDTSLHRLFLHLFTLKTALSRDI